MRARGVTLSFATLEEMAVANDANVATWNTLNILFEHRASRIPRDTVFCMLGRNARGEIVSAQAARIFDLAGTNLRDYFEGGHVFPDTAIRPRDYTMTAPAARRITGRVAYSGGTWVRPDFRGRQLATLMPRMSRAIALGQWGSDFTIAFINGALLETKATKGYGYTKAERRILVMANGKVSLDGALHWMATDELLSDMARFGTGLIPEVDVAATARRA